jgi:hypothetical protein
MAPGNGLRNQPERDEPCQFLVFEDFGTIGLIGDPEEHRVVDGVTNHFLNFFRAEGHSDKGGEDRGSWGVGKTVFPRASRIGSFFGLTVRSDDNSRLLLGRSILKYHSVGNTSYKSDGYFGVSRKDQFILPTDDPKLIDRFCTDFRIARQDESGLAIVVPWCENGGDGVTREKVLAAVLRGFFYPILMGHLRVTIATPANEITLDSESLLQTIPTTGDELSRDLLPLAQLAEWAQTRTSGEFLALVPPAPDVKQKWSDDLVPLEAISQIRQSLAQRHRVAISVPMHIHPRSGSPSQRPSTCSSNTADKTARSRCSSATNCHTGCEMPSRFPGTLAGYRRRRPVGDAPAGCRNTRPHPVESGHRQLQEQVQVRPRRHRIRPLERFGASPNRQPVRTAAGPDHHR